MSSLSYEEVIVYILNSLGDKYMELTIVILVRDSLISHISRYLFCSQQIIIICASVFYYVLIYNKTSLAVSKGDS